MNIQVLKMMFVKSLGFTWHVSFLQSSELLLLLFLLLLLLL